MQTRIPAAISMFRFKPPVAAMLGCFAGLMITSAPAGAQIATSGQANSYPGVFAIGPGNTNLGNNGLYVGTDASGALSVLGGSLLQTGALSVGNGLNGGGNGTVTASGIGTRIALTGDGISPGVVNRFEIGNWGTGSFTLAQGATLDGRANANACLGTFHYCNNFIGNAAGSNGSFTLTGAGTNASFLRGFYVGAVNVFHPPIDNFTFGTPGGTSQGRVEVLDGALLRTERTFITQPPGGSIPLGTERSFADVLIRGSGSTWLVQPPSLESGNAFFNTGNGPNAWATVNIAAGGKLRLEGAPTLYNNINLTNGAGRTDFTVTGAGSRVEMAGGNTFFQVGASLGTANMQVLDGAVVDGPFLMVVGRDGARGQLTIDGAGSRLNMFGTGVANTFDANGAANFQIGRAGTGTVTVSNGGRVEIAATGATTRGPGLLLGFQSGSAGTLNISGANSVVSLTAESSVPGGGSSESFNPFVGVGYDGSGALNISNGGKLLLHGNAFSTVAAPRNTTLYIGGRSTTVAGGSGIARVAGLNSEIIVSGTDANIGVGTGPGSTGQLNLSDSARIAATILTAGTTGGVGVIRIDNARVDLTGQYTGGFQVGAGMAIGDGSDSTGVVTMSNGARVTITNVGSFGTGVTIGGSVVRSGGDGTLNMSGASVLQVAAGADTSGMSVGRSGTGLARVRGASTIDLGGGALYVGRFSGSDGTMIVSENSTVTAGYVGVGRNKTGDGGTGTLIVNGSTLTASTIEIGPNGYLGGNGTISGRIVNYGIVNPGNSPGTLTIDGSFINGLGGRLMLEVEKDGQGGFNTDHLIFKNGSTINLAGLEVRFRFLGDTDPNAFKARGAFVINQFFQSQDAQGNLTNLAAATFDGASFSAQADGYNLNNFAFSTAGGASFTAAPVPEPGEWMMLLAGLGLMGVVARRRRSA